METSVLIAKLGLNDPSVTEVDLFQKLDEDVIRSLCKSLAGNTNLKILKV
jgi:hypothetical protein